MPRDISKKGGPAAPVDSGGAGALAVDQGIRRLSVLPPK